MSDDLRRLFEQETDDAVPAEHERRIRAGLASLLGAPSPTRPPSERPSSSVSTDDSSVSPSEPRVGSSFASSSLVAKSIPLALAGLGLAIGGFVLGHRTAPSSTAREPIPVVVPVASMSSSSPTESTEMRAPPAATSSETSTAPVPSAPSTIAPPRTAPQGTGFDREQSLLERARSALVRHDAEAAQEALDACAREFPRSRHAEERDYLTIQLLRERGDAPGARERARAFLTKYPDSLFRSRVVPLTQ